MKNKLFASLLAIFAMFSGWVHAQQVVTVSTLVSSGLFEPYNMAEDTNGNIYVSDSGNMRIVRIDASTLAVSVQAGVTGVPGANNGASSGPNPAHFNNPQGLLTVSIGGTNGLLVADSGNNLIRFVRFSDGYTVTLAGNINTPSGAVNAIGTNASFNIPVGLDQDTNGNVYIADEYNNVIRVMNLHDPALGVTNLVLTDGTTFHHPNAVAYAGANQLWVSDSYNNSVKLITLTTPTSGSLTTYIGGNSNQAHGTADNAFGPSARFLNPSGLIWINSLGLLISDTGNNSIRLATNNPAYGTTNYAVSTFAGTPDTSGFANGNASSATFNGPEGLCIDPANGAFIVADLHNNAIRSIQYGQPRPHIPSGVTATASYGQVTLTWTASLNATNYNVKRSTSLGGPYIIVGSTSSTSYTDANNIINGTTYYYVITAVGAGGESLNSAVVTATPPIPPPLAPRIGWFDYEGNNQIGFFTVLYPFSILIFNNDQNFAIDPRTNGVSTFFISGPPPLIGQPGVTNGSTPPFYQNNLSYAQPLSLATIPDRVISAINIDSMGQSSPVTTAEIFFQVANPTISGFNGAQFSVSDITSNAVFWYTLDGSDPTNGPPCIGPIAENGTNTAILSMVVTSNLLFKVRAFRSGYTPSGIAQQSFSPSNFVANTMSFGFAAGEASSDFVASPGQTFYAPVTLSPLPNTVIYSLQFNLTVTNGGPNPGPAVTPGAYSFNSFLEEPIPDTTPPIYEYIPPLAFYPYFVINPPPLDQLVSFDGPNGTTNFVSMLVTNLSLNLLEVGWLERTSEKNLYDTTKQTLITYSQAHDVRYTPDTGQVEVGCYAFQVPTNAQTGQTYQIQIARASATSDGVGAPGSDVYIATPTNGSIAGGTPINALKIVTVGQRKYIVGSVYPFRWFNAGDFGSSNIVNADVAQVFQSVIYELNTPPSGTDLYDAMDSCGSYLAYLDNTTGFYTNDTSSVGHSNSLFDGNDTSINQMAYGDGVLDVCDIYVTFRRSLDPSLTWFRRFWNNGQRVADASAPNVANHLAKTLASGTVQPKVQSGSAISQRVNFAAGDITNCSAGQVIQIPITATIFGSYPLRVLMLNLTVVPLDGSPVITVPVQFTQNATTLGAPYTTDSQGNGNYSAVWLNSTNAGLTGTVTIGTLSVTIPNGGSANSAYAVHFGHASASPNGLASFPKSTLTGLITLSSRTNSSYGDGIPDSWRLRWFGTIHNQLSVSNACASGDGVNNWKKYVAGVDPNSVNNFPSVNPKTPVPSGSTAAIHWPTVSGKQYVILSSDSLFPGIWKTNTIVTGTGTDVEYDDNTGGTKRFYRVQILP